MGFLCIMSCALMLYCCEPSLRITQIVDPPEPKAVLIFLHGAGESGPKIMEMARLAVGDFSSYPDLRLVFPTAAAKTLEGFPWSGHPVNIWYGIDSISPGGIENETQLQEEANYLRTVIDEQVTSGIPHHKICVVGFSMGGCMSLHLGYEYVKDLACVGAISGFLPTNSTLLQKMKMKGTGKEKLPPLYMSTGSMDFLIRPSWSQATAEELKSAGVAVTFHKEWYVGHFLARSDLQRLFDFVQRSVGLADSSERTPIKDSDMRSRP